MAGAGRFSRMLHACGLGAAIFGAVLGCGGGSRAETAGPAWGDAQAFPTVFCSTSGDIQNGPMEQVNCGAAQQTTAELVGVAIFYNCSTHQESSCSDICDATHVPRAPCPSNTACLIIDTLSDGGSVGKTGYCP